MRRGWWPAGLVVAVVVAACAPAALAEEGPSTTTTSMPSQAFPTHEVVSRSEAALGELRTIDREVARSVDVETIAERLPGVRRSIQSAYSETLAFMAASPPLSLLDGAAAPWTARRTELDAWAKILVKEAEALEHAVVRIDDLRARWDATRANLIATAAPHEIVERADSLVASIGASRGRASERRRSTLVLQERVARELSRCDSALARIQDARRAAVGGIFENVDPPLWAPSAHADDWRRAVVTVRETAAEDMPNGDEWMTILDPRRVGWGAMMFALAGLLVTVRTRVRGTAPDDLALVHATRVFDYPLAVAATLVLYATRGNWQSDPRLVRLAIVVIAAVALTRIVRATVAPVYRLPIVGVAVFFVFDQLRHFCFAAPGLERLLLLVELVVFGVFAAWGARRVRAVGPLRREDRFVMVVAGILSTAALAAAVLGAVGLMRFARVVEVGVLRSTYIGVTLVGVVAIGEGVLVGLLHSRALAPSRVLEVRRAWMHDVGLRVMRGVAVVVWLGATLGQIGLLQPAGEVLAAVMGATFERGAVRIALGDVVAFVVSVWVALNVSRAIRVLLREDVFPRMELERGLPEALSSLVHYAILFIGFLVALGSAGIGLDRVVVLTGALGVGIGFGLQQIVNNFVSGLILLFERPVRIGDIVQVGDVHGAVRHIGIRASTVRTLDGADVIVPNANLVTDRVTNWTLHDNSRRIDVRVGVAYGTDAKRVTSTLREAALAQRGLVAEPPPNVLFLGLGDSSLDFEIRAFTDLPAEAPLIRSELVTKVYEALREAGITVPFPQRDLHVRSIDPDAARLLRGG